ncbi:hypothetical protein PTKIN_Ptkin16aG0503100 [Pterospermum kingtungense]
MAEAIVSLAIKRISELLIHEAVFLSGVGDQVERLKDELDRMKGLLKDANYQQEQTEFQRTLVRQIRDLAYEAEYVIHSFILDQVAHQGGFIGIIKRFTSMFTRTSHQQKIGVDVKAILTKLEHISNSDTLWTKSLIPGPSSISRTQQQQLRRTYSHVEEVDVVSLDGVTRDVLAQLMTEEEVAEGRLHVIVSIVGLGGIEQTEQIDNLKEDELIRRLFNVLKQKCYLVVLDDIWRSQDWSSLKPAFPQGRKGSRILFTTRNKEVALLADPCNSPIELPFLTDDESWMLFKRKAFPGNMIDSQARSKEFETIGRKIVKKCGGLPLAIVVLGGWLAAKSHYPEDLEISIEELIRLWIAKGFILSSLKNGEVMEDVAEQYLEELINRCLIQVGKRDYAGIGVETCRIHDLLRDLCVDKAREEKFLEIIQPPSIENHGDSSDVTLSASMLRRNIKRIQADHFQILKERRKTRVLCPLAVRRISDLLNDEAVYMAGVRDEVEGQCAQLKRMQSFLEDADHKQQQYNIFPLGVLTCRLPITGRSFLEDDMSNFQVGLFLPNFFICRKSRKRSKQSKLSLKIFQSLPDYEISGEGRGLALIPGCCNEVHIRVSRNWMLLAWRA